MPLMRETASGSARSATEPGSSSWRSRCVASTFALVCFALVGGCAPEPDATLVGLPGCGLDSIELNALRIIPRGDFPSTAVPQLLLRNDGGSVFEDLPDDVRGITVEGRFNEITEAVGRTARLDPEGDLPVYFAPPDQLCNAPSMASGRDPGGVGLAAAGDVLVVGGRMPDGRLTDEIVHYRDIGGLGVSLDVRMPAPSTGHTVHGIGPRELLVLGGSTAQPRALADAVRIDLSQGPERAAVSEPVRIQVPKQPEPGRAHHAAAHMPSGRILVTGGCTRTTDGRCETTADSVLRTGFVVIPAADGLQFEPVAPMLEARYGHSLLVARDAVTFAVGGRTFDGRPITRIERLRPGRVAWESYGPPLSGELAPDVALVGATLLEGGLLVLAASDDSLWWVSESGAGVLTRWCDAASPCFEPTPPGLEGRSMLTLPGERVVADTFVLPVALVGLEGADALDLSVARPGMPGLPPPHRLGAATLLLDDGTVLFAGGRDARTGASAQPLFLRLRPGLDGPDEEIPDVAGMDAGAFVAHDMPTSGVPRITLEGDALAFRTAFLPEPLPRVWAHIRGFRSARFRLEVTIMAAGALPHIVLSHGAIARTSIRFDGPQGGADKHIRWVHRDAQGRTTAVTCGPTSPLFEEPGVTLRLDVQPDGIEIRALGDVIAQCPGPGSAPVAVGFGASDSGNLRISNLRLTRI
jgi:hypothetical protein